MEVVFITVAVQKGLEDIKKGLKSKGYEVVDFGDYNYPIDALIYLDNIMEFSLTAVNNLSEGYSGKRNNYGVFMVNSKGKTIEEIDQMLKRRCYTPLI